MPPMADLEFAPAAPPELLRPARQAAMLFVVLGAMALIAGAMFFLSASVPIEEWPPEARRAIMEMADHAGLTVRQCILAPAFMMTFIGILLMAVAFFVRRGRHGMIIFAIILDVVMMAILGIQLAGALRQVSGADFFPFLMLVGVGAIMAVLLRRLLEARRAAGALAAYEAQYRAQNWQYFQEPFDPSAGYSYGTQTPLPPPPPQAPPPANSNQ
jgi:hypothetical protein